MVERGTELAYDVFISYSHTDKEWVWLVPRLKEAGLAVCTDRESFDVGVPALVSMENAGAASRHTLLPSRASRRTPGMPGQVKWAAGSCLYITYHMRRSKQ